MSHMEYTATCCNDLAPNEKVQSPIPPHGPGWHLVAAVTFPVIGGKMGVIWYFERLIIDDDEG